MCCRASVIRNSLEAGGDDIALRMGAVVMGGGLNIVRTGCGVAPGRGSGIGGSGGSVNGVKLLASKPASDG